MEEKKKIVVIADDFTGAAEIGGIGLRHGLRVAIEPDPINHKDVDLLVVATDTRSLSPDKAAKKITDITRTVMKYEPFLVYKKIDSVLRGNVSEEIEAQLIEMNLLRSVIIAGNPVFSRIIKDGQYFVENVPLNETSFSFDMQHPIASNDVSEILNHSDSFPLFSKKYTSELPEKGIIMGDVQTLEDLNGWTNRLNGETLLAGASGFFNALLSKHYYPKQSFVPDGISFKERALFILGSSFPKDIGLLDKMKMNGHYHSNMPEKIYYMEECPEEIFRNWVNEIVSGIQQHRKVIVSSIHNNIKDPSIFLRIKSIMARMVREVLKKVEIDELLIEGGSTTSEILNSLQIKKLNPLQELDVGIIRMEIDDMPGVCLTTKPGSYAWPENVWMKEEILKMNSKQENSFASYG